MKKIFFLILFLGLLISTSDSFAVIPCECEWQNRGCGLDCNPDQMSQIKQCSPPNCLPSQEGLTQCVDHPDCSALPCECDWEDRGCGLYSCDSDKMSQIKQCNPPNCSSEQGSTQCVDHPDCSAPPPADSCELYCQDPENNPEPAGKTCICNPLKYESFEELIEHFTNFLFYLSIAIVPLIVVIGAFYIMTGGGDPKRVKTGQNFILYAAVGFGIVLFSKLIAAGLKYILGG